MASTASPVSGTDRRAAPAARVRELAKRALDVTLAVLVLPVALPVMAIVGVAARIETPGPILFRQRRVGRDGRAFTVLKLRTMVKDAERIGAGIYFEPNDARVTRVGAIARRYSLDELPQLFNVLAGDMSIVGPRPMLPLTVDEYADDYAVVLRVRPGITGLAQVSGRNELSRRQRLELDKRYVREWSVAMDLRIIARTIGVALRADGQRSNQSRDQVEQ